MFIPWWLIIVIIILVTGSYANMKRSLESEISDLELRIEELEEGENDMSEDFYEFEEYDNGDI